MLNRLYCLFIILLCTSNLLSPVVWIPPGLCEQYRYRQWIRGSNIIIIVPDPPPGLSLSVARSADFPASGEDCCCNFSSVWAVNNILCGAASHTVIDAHIAVISGSGSLPPDSHHPPLCPWEIHVHHEERERVRERERGGGGLLVPKCAEEETCVSLDSPTMVHCTTKPWVFIWKIIKDGYGNEWGWAFFIGGGGHSIGCKALTGMQNHTVAFDVRSSPWRQQCDLREVEPGGNVIVFIVGAPCLDYKENITVTWKHHHLGCTLASFFCTMVTGRHPPTR